ncbi:MAG: trifunctional serine/threonine-protein kinase/ATP-binding protein/sensor histidine kinase [Raineya sp.]|jgi:predicted ATPase/signal transduction histidine kinase|nr:trifunctional serine/threonine-protein kinase/ATP-binding protein/sensor histidine kinase [Raineya sp.]
MQDIPKDAKLIANTVNSQIYYIESGEYQLPIVIKVLKSEFPSSKQIVQLKNELDYTTKIDISGIRKGYKHIKINNRHALLLEYFDGHSVKEAIKQKIFDLRSFLEMAIVITEVLGEIHQKNIIHKDLNSNNILIDMAKKSVRIIDFGMAVNMDLKNQKLENPETLEGTLAYISPEQTGRMNRVVDYRSDLYSLGVTFYEIVTGHLPFESQDATELVHSHLAKTPLAPHLSENPSFSIPIVISNIILKLLEKNAENRYQSAQGLKKDLENCLEQLKKYDKITAVGIGENDYSGRFQINQYLYGRNKEKQLLMQSFENVTKGNNEIVMVGGYSGVGKTALIHEVHKPITEKKGYFISGKFEQLQKNIPYSAINHAFTELADILLTESQEKLMYWKTILNHNLKPNGKVLTDVVPQLELIMGTQPEIEILAPAESQNRFKTVFQKFLNVIASEEHPLIVFLDDLQWADIASFNIIKEVLEDYHQSHLMIIGAYRTNEVDETHPLQQILNNLVKNKNYHHIHLQNLTQENTNQLVADTLKCQIEETIALSEFIFNKTQGNAFFVTHFLKALYENNLLKFDFNKKVWKWDMAEIKKLHLPNNVVEFMAAKIQSLDESTQDVLKLAACIGNKFDLKTLSIIYEKPLIDTFFHLGEAINEGFVIPLEGKLFMLDEEILQAEDFTYKNYEYKFVHDRIQQAVYSLIEDDKKSIFHYKIAKLLYDIFQKEQSNAGLLDITNHFNQGQAHLQSHEVLVLIKLNLESCYLTTQATAFEASLIYINQAFTLFNQYNISNTSLKYQILLQKSELEFLNGNLEQSLELSNQLLNLATNNLDKASIYNRLILHITMKGDYQTATEYGIKALQLLDIPFSLEQIEPQIGAEVHEINILLGDKTIDSLLELPELKDAKSKLAIAVLMNMQTSAYYTDKTLWTLLNVKAVLLSIRNGNTQESASAYFGYGVVLCAVMGNYQAGYQFGKLAYDLSLQFNSLSQLCKSCNIFANFITIWTKHLSYTEKLNDLGFQAGIDSGELQFAGFLLVHKTINPFLQGRNLEIINQQVIEYIRFAQKTNNKAAFDALSAIKVVFDNLTGHTNHIHHFSNELFDQAKVEEMKQKQEFLALATFLPLQGLVYYIYEDYSKAKQVFEEASAYIFVQTGTFFNIEYSFFYSLTLLKTLERANAEEQTAIFEQIENNQKQMKNWADSCPENYLHKYLLVEAELAHIKGDTLAAINLYDEAIKGAEENEFAYNEAIANELAAKFWLSLEKLDFAKLYIKKAYYLYDQWGAKRKKELLSQKYAYFLTDEITKNSLFTELTTTATTNSGNASNIIDLNSILKASQAISKEIVLENLLKNMLKIVIENAGAEKGFLIDYELGELKVLVKGTTDSQQIENKLSINKYQQSLPLSIINYVARTRKNVVIKNATEDLLYNHDSYIQKSKPKSVLCFPVIRKGELSCVIYLENNLVSGIFTDSRIAILDILSSQIAISIENALLYENLENKIKELTVANKELDLFIYRASHDLKGPIASLLGLSEIAQQDVKDEEAKGYFDMLRRTAKNMNKTLEKLLVINLINQEEEKSEINFINIQKAIESKFHHIASVNSVHLYFDIEQNLSLYSYAHLIGIVIENLIENGIVFRMLHHSQHEQYVHTRIFSQNKNIIIEVEDNGTGIHPEQLPKIFEMFHRGSELSNGNGLGLYLVDKIIKRIGGHINVTTTFGTGSTFMIQIPFL